MYPPPGTALPLYVAVTICANSFSESAAFYTALFASIGVEPVTVDLDPQTICFMDRILVRDQHPVTEHAEVIFYAPSRRAAHSMLQAVAPSEQFEEDDDAQQLRVRIHDPGGNVVWIVTSPGAF